MNKFSLTRYKFVPEMYLRKPVLTYSARGSFRKTKQEYKSLKEQEIHNIFLKTD